MRPSAKQKLVKAWFFLGAPSTQVPRLEIPINRWKQWTAMKMPPIDMCIGGTESLPLTSSPGQQPGF
jgi:hypothetical protein